MRTTLALLLTLTLAAAPLTPARADNNTHTVQAAPNINLRVRDFGDNTNKPPVLMLTGGPGFAGAQLLSTAESLAATRRVILPDQRGTGESTVDPLAIDPALFNFAQAVADLETIRTSLNIETWSIAGHSWGGLLAMLYAAQHPDRVDSLALISPAGIESSFWQTYQQNIFDNLTDAQRQSLGTIPPPADQSPGAIAAYIIEANTLMAPAMLANKEALLALQDEMTQANFNPIVSLSMQDEMQSYDLREQLKDFTPPVLVIQGDADPIGRSTADTIIESFQNDELTIIENCGHWPMLEQPAALNTALTKFFNDH